MVNENQESSVVKLVQSCLDLSLIVGAFLLPVGQISITVPIKLSVGGKLSNFLIIPIVLWVVLCVLQRRFPARPRYIGVPFLVLLGTIVLSSVTAIYPYPAAKEALIWVLLTGAVWALYDTLRQNRLWAQLAIAFIVGHVVLLGVSYYQMFIVGPQEYPRLVGSFDHPNRLLGYLLLSLPICLFGAFHARWDKNTPRKTISAQLPHPKEWFWPPVLLLSLMAVMGTVSRSSWLSVPVTLLAWIVLTKQWRIGGLILVLAIMCSLPFMQAMIERSSGMTQELRARNSKSRFVVWDTVLATSAEDHRVAFGSGLGSGMDLLSAQYHRLSPFADGRLVHHAHNLYLGTFTATGLFGLVALVWLLCVYLDRLFSYYKAQTHGAARQYVAVVCAATIGFLVQETMDWLLLSDRLLCLFLALAVSALAVMELHPIDPSEEEEVSS